MIKKIPYPDQAGWLEIRKHAIGGSEAAAILGLSPWSSPLHVYADKVGLIPELEDNEAMRLGRDLEQYVADRFCEETGKRVHRENHILVNEELPFMHASIDRKVNGERAGLECKTTSLFNKSDFKNGDINPYYYCQCQHYMAVTGYPKWYLAVLVLGAGFYWFEVSRNEDDIAALIETEQEFWKEHVCKQIPPEPLEQDSDLLKQFYPQAELKKTIELENLRPTARRYAEIDRMIKEAENEKKLLGNQLKAAMGDAEVCLCGEYKIQWSNRVSNRLDTTLLKKEKPEIYNEFAKQSQTRTFTYKENIA